MTFDMDGYYDNKYVNYKDVTYTKHIVHSSFSYPSSTMWFCNEKENRYTVFGVSLPLRMFKKMQEYL